MTHSPKIKFSAQNWPRKGHPKSQFSPKGEILQKFFFKLKLKLGVLQNSEYPFSRPSPIKHFQTSKKPSKFKYINFHLLCQVAPTN